jgi:integrase
VTALLDKPTGLRHEARWLEVHDAFLFLEAARTYKPERPEVAMPFIFPLVAAFVLTGGRESEVLGLEVGDVSFDRKTVTFRPNGWRRLKTLTSDRPIRLWPQLSEILKAHIREHTTAGGLLFPSVRTEKPSMVTDVRKALDAVGERAGWKPGEIRTKMFRYTYCAARLQTLDRGAPVSLYTVGKELGHGGDSLVKRVYGDLGEVRQRGEVVEYRAEQAIAAITAEPTREAYRERLKALQAAG